MRDKVLQLAKEKNAVILAHYYQTPDIQEIADFKGDSLALAQKASEVDADIILFAGVHFMAETAKILNPTRKVLLPDLEAGCSLAESCPADDFRKFKALHPNHIVISYINCTAEIKTLSDVICTSGNAVQIVESFPKDQKIIFAPDKNLGRYINEVTGRQMVLWDGTCEVHDILSSERIMKMKLKILMLYLLLTRNARIRYCYLPILLAQQQPCWITLKTANLKNSLLQQKREFFIRCKKILLTKNF